MCLGGSFEHVEAEENDQHVMASMQASDIGMGAIGIGAAHEVRSKAVSQAAHLYMHFTAAPLSAAHCNGLWVMYVFVCLSA